MRTEVNFFINISNSKKNKLMWCDLTLTNYPDIS